MMRAPLYITILVLIGGYVSLGAQLNSSRHQYEVQQLCDFSHFTNDTANAGQLEQSCGDLQDQYGVEYLCNTSQCWVEVK